MDGNDNRELVERWRNGDQSAADELFQRFAEPIVRLAEKNTADRFGGRFGADDILQTTFRTWFERTRNGNFDFRTEDSVWTVLKTIALNKIRNKVSHETAMLRSVDREIKIDAFDQNVADAIGAPASEYEAIELHEAFHKFLDSLPEELRKLSQLEMEGRTSTEIAEALDVSTRTLRRWKDQIRERAAAFAPDAFTDL